RHSEPVGVSCYVLYARKDLFDLLGLLAVDDRGNGAEDLGALVDDVGHRSVAAAARHVAVRAADAASRPGSRAGADDPLLHEALLRVLDDLPRAVELLHLLLFLLPLAVVADGPLRRPDHASLRRQFRPAHDQRDDGLDLL